MPGPTGYVYDPAERDRIMADHGDPTFAVCARGAVESGRGKLRLLTDAVKTVIGRHLVWRQNIGDCVSFGAAKAVTISQALNVVAGTGTWKGEVATEPIYGFSRVEIGKRRLGRSDGSVGLWAIEALHRLGTLFRQPYGKFDLTAYSGTRAKEWGWDGVPDELEPVADDYLVVEFAQLSGWEDYRDAIWNGWPAFICSDWLPGRRDSHGFASRDGSGGHCEAGVGMDDSSSRPGALIDGSWGAFEGPKGEHDIPDSAYWCDAGTIDSRIRRYNDSFCIKTYQGPPSEPTTDWVML